MKALENLTGFNGKQTVAIIAMIVLVPMAARAVGLAK